ncbi:hypothetical protein ACFYO0_38450 [Streptomyces sp. NPDC006365]|uniref:hypothetical protein n=1 Tax=Streptomyces sp. NPDC006365 TaxID=3364744 RepID=UPI00367FD10C
MTGTPGAGRSFTTPPRPVDVAALFPELAPLARTATRLHPRPGAPTAHDSSVGGPLLWPADKPWPHCEEPHEKGATTVALSPDDIRLLRRNQAAITSRRHLGHPASLPTPDELATSKRIRQGRPWPEGPIPLLPVAQLYARDVPLPTSPPGADLLQVLWCPFDHPTHPRTVLRWRSAATVTDVLDTPPEPPAIKSQGYLPEPSLLAPEQVTEYPNFMELDKELQQQLADPSRWQGAGAALDGSCSTAPEVFYRNCLSIAPGWKVGGWPFWGSTDPLPRLCPACSIEMDPLLTIATFEWDDDTRSWSPEAEQARPRPSAAETDSETQAVVDFFRAQGIAVHDRGRVGRTHAAPPVPDLAPRQPTAVQIGRGGRQQLYICPLSSDHPHLELMQ